MVGVSEVGHTEGVTVKRQVTCGGAVFLCLVCTGKDKETFLLTVLIAYVFIYLLSDLGRITSNRPDSLQAHHGGFTCQVTETTPVLSPNNTAEPGNKILHHS